MIPDPHPILPGIQRVEVWCADLILREEWEEVRADRTLHPLQTELLPRCGEIESVGKVVQEDGRMLLIAVLEVSWNKWGFDGVGRPSLLRQLAFWSV
jgi:hypothetical protein